MSLEYAHEQLGWPSREEILHPAGVGARIFAELSAEKVGKAIGRLADGEGVQVGILASDAEATDPPIAIVCEFPRKVSEETLAATQKLAWNFGRAPLLITIEPHIIRKWTCCEPPAEAQTETLLDSPEIDPPIHLDPANGSFTSEAAAASLHWVELVSGEFFRRHEDRFRPERRADQMLLSNLRAVRQELIDLGLDDDTSHDLLARIIFIQFLFDRQDSDGTAALSPAELHRLHAEELLDGVPVLSKPYETFGDILYNANDTYALFRWLDSKFNGDLFPGKDNATSGDAWAAERERVQANHLQRLALFVNGQEQMKNGQRSLWPYYSFDAIPLEFISTIYEEFVKKDVRTGVHYTPSHVADLILDSVLPWEGDQWDLKILDPACGSGVFLVKAFQRLVFRWKAAHAGQRITGQMLAHLLEQNLFGVDLDVHAVRVASFSLYLALCDEIDPRDYWREVHFPILRNIRLIASDFFNENHTGFRTDDGSQFDVVIGNPPWGKNTATPLARDWCGKKRYNWPLSYGDIGPLFVAKALALTKPSGTVGLLQPASTLLYNSTSAAEQFRTKLFGSFHVEEIINFAALRYVLFRDAIVPACAVVVRKEDPTGEPFWYTCPKPHRAPSDRYRIVVEPQDVEKIYPDEIQRTPWIWSALLWGGRRDLQFVNWLSRLPNLATLEASGQVKSRQGIIRSSNSRVENEIVGRRLLDAAHFPEGDALVLSAASLPVNQDPLVDDRSSRDYRAFELPQLVLKQSWQKDSGRFRAVMIDSDIQTGGVLCTDSYLSIHAAEAHEDVIEKACLTYNSIFSVYYLLLTSGRFAMDRNEPQAEAFRGVPLPTGRSVKLGNVTSAGEVDTLVREAFGFQEADWLLVDDLIQYTLADYKGGENSPGRRFTRRRVHQRRQVQDEPELGAYCETIRRVLHAAYGSDKKVGTVIYSEPNPFGQGRLPVRMVSVFLNMPSEESVRVEPMQSDLLQARLTELYKSMLSTDEDRASFYRRCARTYDTLQTDDGGTAILVNIIKPDQVRYWTRSMALRDADEVAADLMLWRGSAADFVTEKQVVCG